MKRNTVSLLSAISGAFCILLCSSCSNNNEFDKVKNIQMGKTTESYFNAYARQENLNEALDIAKLKLDEAFEKADTTGKCYGLGSFGGAINATRYDYEVTSGIFDSISRQPEESEHFLLLEDKTINYILNSTNDVFSEMIGLSSTSLNSSLARQPELYTNLNEYSTYIYESIFNVKIVEHAYSIGYGSIGFYDGIARKPEIVEQAWAKFKSFIDNLK